jgi:hypothetical protein
LNKRRTASVILTQKYIWTRTADENPVLGPTSYLIILIQHICRKTDLTAMSNTHKYAGATAQSRLKNRMTRHESRRPSPKVTGPNEPDANLRKRSNHWSRPTRANKRKDTHGSMFIFADNHTKNILTKCVSVLSSTSTGWIPIKIGRLCESDSDSRYPAEHSSIRVDRDSRSTCDTHPASPPPSPGVFPK